MKTLVTAKHAHGPHVNGYDDCYARWAERGMCPGIKNAAWLNELGEDDEYFILPSPGNPAGITNLAVRLNWLRSNQHLVAVNTGMAALLEERTRLKKALSRVSRQINEMKKSLA